MKTELLINNHKGFTLMELIITIILISVLAVVVVPRFQGSSGYAEYTYQARLVSALRAMQQRAMQDTRSGYCFQLNLNTGVDSSFGPPTLDYSPGNQATTCLSQIDNSDASASISATIEEMQDDKVRIISAPNKVQFSSLGCPIVAGEACQTSHRIEIVGEQSLFVCVESQGFVHACL